MQCFGWDVGKGESEQASCIRGRAGEREGGGGVKIQGHWAPAQGQSVYGNCVRFQAVLFHVGLVSAVSGLYTLSSCSTDPEEAAGKKKEGRGGGEGMRKQHCISRF